MTPAEARANLAAVLAPLAPDVQVHERTPDRWTPPALALVPADPWIVTTDEDMTWQSGEWRFVVQLVGRSGTPNAGSKSLEDHLADVLTALYASGSEWTVEQVAKPGVLPVGDNSTFPAVEITVAAPLPIV